MPSLTWDKAGMHVERPVTGSGSCRGHPIGRHQAPGAPTAFSTLFHESKHVVCLAKVLVLQIDSHHVDALVPVRLPGPAPRVETPETGCDSESGKIHG